MRVERLLQMSIATLAALGSLLLAVGQQGDSLLPVLASIAAFGSVYLTDIKGWISLNRHMANFAAIVAVLFSFFDFWGEGSDGLTKLHAIAKLLIYLHVLLLFQAKSTRIYWHLIVLSLLQVVVAAALNLSLSFGLMLILYMFAALTALKLFFIYRETLRVDPELKAAHDAIENRPLLSFLPTWQAEPAPTAVPAISLAGQLPANLATAFTGGRMFSQVFRMGLFTLLAAFIFFCSFPRFERDRWNQSLGGLGAATTGFKDEIDLDGMGQILQSDIFVMRVRLTYPQTGKLIETDYEPYFRGTSLSSYSPINHAWIVGNRGDIDTDIRSLAPGGNDKDLVLQQVATNQSIQFDQTPQGTLLFSMYPAYASPDSSGKIRDNVTRGVLSMEGDGKELRRQPSQYEMLVPWHPFGVKGTLRPVERSLRERIFRNYIQLELTEIPLDQGFADNIFDGLKKVAAETIQELPPADRRNPYQAALKLEQHFVLDGGYTYSLGVPLHLKDRSIDPIEDFVINHRTGHCEYFASALALMLRSQGIPARVVVGYRGGEFNSFGGYYAVKQKHAHAWVEAYIPSDQLPGAVNPKDFPHGAWLRLDPTPASRPSINRPHNGGLVDSALDWFDYVELAWRDYVVGMNSQRQEEGIYKPLTDSFVKPLEGWVDRAAWTAWFRGKLEGFGIQLSDRGFNGFASMFTMALLLILVVLFEVGRNLFRYFQPKLMRIYGRLFRVRHQGTGFYLKAERFLTRAGWSRKPSETPREYVEAIIADCHRREIAQPMLQPLDQLVHWYYQVRYANRLLAEEDHQRINEHLATISEEAAQVKKNRSRRKPTG